jgi:hypothetical protein
MLQWSRNSTDPDLLSPAHGRHACPLFIVHHVI